VYEPALHHGHTKKVAVIHTICDDKIYSLEMSLNFNDARMDPGEMKELCGHFLFYDHWSIYYLFKI
jgi:hypothetical protein